MTKLMTSQETCEVSSRARVSSSFRDPSGYLFIHKGILYRAVSFLYREHYDQLMGSGLYQQLVDERLLIPHGEVSLPECDDETFYKIIKPEVISFISCPYEWSFSQLKAAALTTLKIQKMALAKGMSLKDSSAYNIQFREGKPVLIDTLSFEKYQEGKPWVAYRQFCQHFLAPLALMCKVDVRLNSLLRDYLDGVPVDLASAMLPWGTRFNPSLFMHIHLHARTQQQFANKAMRPREYNFSRISFEGIIDSLSTTVSKLTLKSQKTEWGDYYNDTNYSVQGFEHKKQIVRDFLAEARSKIVWDLGGNVGVFSRLASDQGIPTLCFDIDPAAVDKNYQEVVVREETHILPLVLDITNPSPGIGWANNERDEVWQRGSADTVMALALIHHLAISNNLPFFKIVEFFHNICEFLIIEFVPREDSQVQRLLSTRQDIFPGYTKEGFEEAFMRFFKIRKNIAIRDSKRTLYLMQKI